MEKWGEAEGAAYKPIFILDRQSRGWGRGCMGAYKVDPARTAWDRNSNRNGQVCRRREQGVHGCISPCVKHAQLKRGEGARARQMWFRIAMAVLSRAGMGWGAGLSLLSA